MKLLIYEWASYLQYDVDWVCREKGVSVKKFSWQFRNKNVDEAFEKWFGEQIDTAQFDALFSVNYWPMLSKVAQKHGIRYIAWCYDNPLNVVNIEETLANPVNTVIFFDRVQTQKYLDAGFETVYYLPLCVNTARMAQLQLSKQDAAKYGADVALVGSLYESKMQELKALMGDYTKGYIEAVMAAQQNLYGCYLFEEVITDKIVQDINDFVAANHPESKFCLLKEALTFAMASEVTRKDRLILLTLLGRRFDTRLYSFQNSEILQGVKCFPPIDYVAEMPKVFRATKVNLNPVLRCIQSGIPLRALDVMGAGGFLLSSFQPELAEYFLQEEEMVMYESMEDAVAKADFYIRNDDLREKIATAGANRISEMFSLSDRWNQIMQLAGCLV